jgi:hypothetical protein
MRILDLRIGWFNSGDKKKRKTVTRMERVANAALLEAANHDPKVLFEIINKHGKIREYDKIESDLQKVENQIYQKAARNMLKDGNRALDAWIDELIDRVMGTERHYGQQNDTVPFHQPPDIQHDLERILSSLAFLRSPKLAAILDKLTGKRVASNKTEQR